MEVIEVYIGYSGSPPGKGWIYKLLPHEGCMSPWQHQKMTAYMGGYQRVLIYGHRSFASESLHFT